MNQPQPNPLRCLILLLLIFSTQTKAFSQNKTDQIDRLMTEAHALKLFNGNVLVMHSGKLVYQGSFGAAEANAKVKLTKDYRFNIGSIAKEFNAVAIMMLKEQKKLSLEDAVSKYLPELPAWADKITVRNLLQYTSGVPNSNWKETKGDLDNLNNLRKVTALDFEPGTKYAYNNNNVFLQRQIVAKVSGLSFNDFVRNKMLKPLGIEHAVIDPAITEKLLAHAYSDEGIEDDLTPPFSGWTNLNINDFYTWSEAINTYRLISPASTRELLIPFSAGNQTGLGRGEMAGNKLISHIHDGTSRNYQALLISQQDKGLTIILQTNNQKNNLTPISRSIQAIMEDKPYAKIRKSLLKTYGTEMAQMNGKQILEFYEQTKAKDAGSFSFDSEDLLNEVGYSLLGQNKAADAVEIFAYNAKLFPNSANVFDSLGEAYLRAGDKAAALANYQKALRLDSQLESAKKMIAELSR
jgi:CubicO group peptidase (beta-lactamase class C family)